VPINQGQSAGTSSYVIGQQGGTESVVLSGGQMPLHNHLVNCVGSGGTQASPVNGLPAVESTGTSLDFSTAAATGQMSASMLANAGGTTPVPIMQPYLCVNFIIAVTGIFPSRN